MRPLPIGIQDFEILRNEGYLYVDKTAHLIELTRGGYFFFSRPRRFGKSLLISTLEALFRDELPKRLGCFGLELAEEKTRIIKFGWAWGRESKRFNFLGFELSWRKDRKGKPNVRRRTARPKLRQTLKGFGKWFKENRSVKLNKLIDRLNAKLKGYYGYFGVIGNSKSLGEFHHQLCRLLFKWLNRRSQKKSLNWTQFTARVSPRLLNPRITEKRVLQRELPGIRC